MKFHKKTLLIILLFFASIVLLVRCINNAVASNDPRGVVYAGSQTCRQCHQAIYDSFITTAHAKASALSLPEHIKGSFAAGHNEFVYDSATKIVMEKRDGGLFQVLYKNNKEVQAFSMDIAFGGKHAQTFLYWKGFQTFELPVSHYTIINNWATSPGYMSAKPNFSRLINADCFECHASYINSETVASESGYTPKMDKSSIIYGIDCERCHGPSINHVNYHLAYPDEKNAKYMRKNISFTQQQKNDACEVCHGGNDREKVMSKFSFQMGDTLDHLFIPGAKKDAEFDVHGNQSRLLYESKCFTVSKILNCNTCHDPHKNADDNVASYSQKCMTCHKEADHTFCPMAASLGESIKSNCIDCHMPKKASQAIVFKTSSDMKTSEYLLRTHKIAIYKDELNIIAAAKKIDANEH